jgi:DnaJ-like protein
MNQERLSRRMVETVAENRIRQAIEEGQFDDLPGLGKPIPDIDEPYDPAWWIKQWIRREGVGTILAEKFGRESKFE